ncbi:MarR family winged helix-turn-helix transcriptional regulator [Paenibacillus kandeliae]|uniref:MarR family winged helix-turn-helix transcriptional regulator n=1 Tax=Paenibacillus kandeliae TaxID=3231269 RepID=UPI003457DB4A
MPQLGSEPYNQLCDQTAAPETSSSAAQLGLLMLWNSDHILDVIDDVLAPYDISESKLDLLLLIRLHENQHKVTASALAQRLGIRRASATILLNSVEKKGWIYRQQSEEDGRKSYIYLTSSGKQLVDTVLPVFWEACASLVQDLDEQEQQVLQKIMLKLNVGIENRLGSGR